MSLTAEQQKLFDENGALGTSLAMEYLTKFSSQPWLIELDDLKQVAAIGLFKAVQKFDPSKGYAFSTYAVPMIKGYLNKYVFEHSSPIKIPRVKLSSKEVTQRRDEIFRVLCNMVSLDKPVSEWEGIGSGFEDIIGKEDPDLDRVEELAEVQKAVQSLTVEEKTLIYMRYGLDMSQSEIARRLGTMTQPTVAKHLKKIIKKLQVILNVEVENEISNLC